MRNRIFLALFIGALGLIGSTSLHAQDALPAALAGGKYVISARAGGVNFTSGTVSLLSEGGSSAPLRAGADLQINDRVSTGSDGKTEILLNPGSYLRVGSSSSFKFVSTDLENLGVDLKSGSFVFEVITPDDLQIAVRTPQTEVALSGSGVFRFDIMPDGTAKLFVFKGKILVGPSSAIAVGSGRVATLLRSGISVMRFSQDDNDALNLWSKERSRELTKANAQLRRDVIYDAILRLSAERGPTEPDSLGFWVFDSSRRTSCFLPFGYGWSSPYGWGYSQDMSTIRLHSSDNPAQYDQTARSGCADAASLTPELTTGDLRRTRPCEKMRGAGVSDPASGYNDGVTDGGNGRDNLIVSPPSGAPSNSQPTSSGSPKGKPGR